MGMSPKDADNLMTVFDITMGMKANVKTGRVQDICDMDYYHISAGKYRYLDEPGSGVHGSKGGGDVNLQSPMFGEDWHRYFNETYGQENVMWESASIQKIINMPSKMTDFSPEQIANLAQANGWSVGICTKVIKLWSGNQALFGLLFYGAEAFEHYKQIIEIRI